MYYLNILANFIVNNFFNDSSCVLILNNKLNAFNYDGTFPYVSINIDGVSVQRHLIFNNYGCQAIVIINENPALVFENLETEMKKQSERFNNRKYLFLPARKQQSDILKVFDIPAARYVADIVVVSFKSKNLDNFENEDCIFDLYTHKYVGSEDSTSSIWLDRWYSVNRSFLLNENLLPDKLQNQHGKVFRMATFSYVPFSILDPPDGVEMLIALEYARKYNMTPEYVLDDGQWGEIFDNWTGYGLVGNVAEDKADIAFAALYPWLHHYVFLDFSRPGLRDAVTCIVPAPRLANGLTTPFLSFSKEMWMMTAVSYLITSATVFIVLSLSKAEENTHNNGGGNLIKSFALSWRIFLLQGFQEVPNVQQSKIIFSFTLTLSLLLTTIYAAGLAHIMMIPRFHGTIHDANDMVANNLPWGATDPIWVLSLLSDTTEVSKKMVNLFITTDEDQLRKLFDKEFAYTVEVLQGGNFAIPKYITLEAAQKRRPLDQVLYSDYTCFVTRKSSILLPSLNKLIYAVMEFGLVRYWEDQVVTRYIDKNTQQAIKESFRSIKSDDVVIKLTFKHVEGAFAIWALGLLVSTCVFIVELLRKNK